MKKLLLGFFVALPFLLIVPVRATEPTSDCVIRDFQGRYLLNIDATLTVREFLKVDCGSLPNKHGIFRILPTQVSRPSGFYNQTKIDLVSITDGTDSGLRYETIRDPANHTLTWKIGDPDTTISGIIDYKIEYVVHNATYDTNGQTIFSWNLSGNFWQLPIDRFLGIVTLPAGLTLPEVNTKLYDGFLGSPTNTYSTLGISSGTSGPEFAVENQKTFLPGIGATFYASFPVGVVTAYQPTFLERYGAYLWWLLPILTFIILFRLWSQKGRDPKLNSPEMVQYEPPRGLTPLEAGLLETMGRLRSQFLTATIIDLAVRKCLTITEIPGGFLKKEDYLLTLLVFDYSKLKSYETTILSKLFSAIEPGKTTKISDQNDHFYTVIKDVEEFGRDILVAQDLLDKGGAIWKRGTMIFASVTLVGGISSALIGYGASGWALVMTGIIGFSFALIMDRRTAEGAKAYWELRGFKEYISKVDKYRMKFYEQENIFEKYLPYAVAFGLTGKWVKACQQLYTEKNLPMVLPLWYIGGAGFDVSNIDSAISSLSSQMGSSLSSSPSSSGSGGGGFSGGGGGGGGGGSW
ncbi:MAG: DUF2207 domain-containing protein [Patescibacteria group bacterium]